MRRHCRHQQEPPKARGYGLLVKDTHLLRKPSSTVSSTPFRIDGPNNVPFIVRSVAEADGGTHTVVVAERALIDLGREIRLGLDQIVIGRVELFEVGMTIKPKVAREIRRSDEIHEVERAKAFRPFSFEDLGPHPHVVDAVRVSGQGKLRSSRIEDPNVARAELLLHPFLGFHSDERIDWE